ncbi:MAG: hypothetical protein AVDCRST_MAG78-53, partial [uncultured Rubrobacteraceae bacterium]
WTTRRLCAADHLRATCVRSTILAPYRSTASATTRHAAPALR